MHRILRARLLASVLVVSVVPLVAAAVPAQAQEQSYVSFDSFHYQLARYGDWVYSDRWGLVWQPADVSDDFRPYYSGGHWVYTDAYGWTWDSDYEWGDIAFHYGRWVDDPYDGWLWIPGYTWSPGWVIWRSNAQSVGWMPMPPDDQFLRGQGDFFIGISFGGISVIWNDTSGGYGYSRWYGRDYDNRRFATYWTFVDTGHMADRDYHRFAYAPDRTITSIRLTRNITNYTVVNHYMVNRSIDVHAVERASGHPVQTVAAAAVFKHPNLVATVEAGQKNRVREFDHAPHGMGVANSAPLPPPTVIDKLSEHVAAHHAGGIGSTGVGGPTHLFTKTSIVTPAATTQFHGKLQTGPIGVTPTSTPVTLTGPQGLHAVPTGGALGTTKTGPGTVTGPTGTHPTSGGNAFEPGGPINKHTGASEPVTGPTAIKGPVTTTGPSSGHITTTTSGGTTSETGKAHDKRTGEDHLTGGTSTTTGPSSGHITTTTGGGTTSETGKAHDKRTGEDHLTGGTSTTTGTAGGVSGHTVTPPAEHLAPVDHNPPPVVQSTNPPATTPNELKKDEPKKDEHKNKGEHGTPN